MGLTCDVIHGHPLSILNVLTCFTGWADAMAKVLRTNKDVEDTGKLLLSKAKKDYERKAKGKNVDILTSYGDIMYSQT